MIRSTLVIVPVRITADPELDALLVALVSLRQSAPEAQILIIEDVPFGTRSLVEAAAEELGCVYVPQDDGAGLVAAASAGLEVARDGGMDAVLIGQDVEITTPGWLGRLLGRVDTQGRPAAVVGGRVDFADGVVEHAGFYYSALRRQWQSRFRGVPAEVAEIRAPTLCPVSARLQLIRHETLAAVGLPDSIFTMPYADIDYCLRVFEAGLECIYEPSVCGRSPKAAVGISRDRTPEEILGNGLLESRHPAVTLDRFIPDLV